MNTPLALQLFSVRNELDKNFEFTLRSLAEMGYTGVEFAGNFGGLSAEELKKLLDELNLKVVGAHMGLDALENDFDANADYLAAIGCDHMICPWADMHDAESAAAIGKRLDAIAEKCAMRGFKFSYHNHGHEFKMTEEGEYLFDIMMDNCSELVLAELDVCWVAMADADPVAAIRKYAGRTELIHLKQLAVVDGKKQDVLFDKGILDLKEIEAAAKLAGVTDFIVEEETPCEDMLDAVRVDIETVRKL